MSEKSNELLLGGVEILPETDADAAEIDLTNEKAIYESTKQDMIDAIGTDEFRYVYLTQKEDIQKQTIKLQRIFVEQILIKISEFYDFEFPEKIPLDTIYDIQKVYLFIEFLEYNSYIFLSYVWKFLTTDIFRLDIEKYCKANDDKVIEEIEEQLDSHPQDSLITIFLRTYYKEKIIQWFIDQSVRFKLEITVENFEKRG